MREIKAQQITDVVKNLCIKANCYLPADVKKRIEDLRAAEPWPQAQEVLDRIIENYNIAEEGCRPICQDTGLACVFVKVGQDVHIDGDLNDAINELLADTKKLNNNNCTIKQHSDTIAKLLSGANALAKDNGISVNFNNSKSKGQNTLTGKMKELDLIGFRDAKINMYDIDYCKGMQQVAEISAKAQVDQIGFDENVMLEISNIRRELVDDLQKQRDKAVERARLLLVENKDLKEFLKDKGLIDEFGKVIDDE